MTNKRFRVIRTDFPAQGIFDVCGPAFFLGISRRANFCVELRIKHQIVQFNPPHDHACSSTREILMLY